jgi:hypothetical protein
LAAADPRVPRHARKYDYDSCALRAVQIGIDRY